MINNIQAMNNRDLNVFYRLVEDRLKGIAKDLKHGEAPLVDVQKGYLGKNGRRLGKGVTDEEFIYKTKVAKYVNEELLSVLNIEKRVRNIV